MKGEYLGCAFVSERTGKNGKTYPAFIEVEVVVPNVQFEHYGKKTQKLVLQDGSRLHEFASLPSGIKVDYGFDPVPEGPWLNAKVINIIVQWEVLEEIDYEVSGKGNVLRMEVP